jgi:uncharacterized protein YdhG (YjbR/CyaY superfamily)
MTHNSGIEAYIAGFPADQQAVLAETLHRIRSAAPEAVESIRYNMAAFRLRNGHPVYFAGWKHHLSLHDIPSLDQDIESEIAVYRSGKDTLKFPYKISIPFDLIERVVAQLNARDHP